MREVLLEQFNVNYDGDLRFVERIVQSNDPEIPSGQFIRTAVHGDAIFKVDEILSRSWIKIGTPGHIPVPDKSIAILNDDLEIVDLRSYKG